MADAPLLTLAYLERLPESSAKVISGMRPEDAAALFETVPTRIVTPVVEKMEKWPAALCLRHLSSEQAVAVLSQVSYQDATVLLRLTPAERRDAILEKLPSRLTNDLKESLRYPRNCVGAWMDPSVPSLSLNGTVKDALAVVRTADRPIGEAIFIVNDDHHLVGVVRTELLLRHAATVRLATIAQTGLKPLFARMLLREAAAVAAWDDLLRLPVAGRGGQLLGTLSRHDLKKGLTTIAAQTGGPETEPLIWTQVGESFVVSVAGLVRLLGDDDADTKMEA